MKKETSDRERKRKADEKISEEQWAKSATIQESPTFLVCLISDSDTSVSESSPQRNIEIELKTNNQPVFLSGIITRIGLKFAVTQAFKC